eukprot:TRINITY_DN1968_c0_g1_i3.p1 TRINITY_DN1968_c0_g1~~TRINITY_DN1968_c0_g1_i3.p1  ORF type:complete len:507 (-),score=63.65 TRINITY_DN1968_c0_g1_i3:488-2008(-)
MDRVRSTPSDESPALLRHTSVDDMKTCVGCGSELQTERSMELGYVPPHKFLQHKLWRQTADASLGLAQGGSESGIADFTLNDLFGRLTPHSVAAADNELQNAASTPPEPSRPRRLTCQRCYELEHYGKVTPAAVDAAHFLEAIKPIRDSNALVVNIVDIFDFQGSFIPAFRKYSGSNPVIIAANKVDLLPDGVQLARVKEWLHREAKALGSGVVSVKLFSAKTGEGIDDLASAIEWYRGARSDVVVMGCANVGKSTLINKLIEKFKGPKQRKVTVSAVPGTTLSLIRLPFGENGWLFDTPGIFSDKQIIRYLSEEDIKKVTPSKRLKPVVERISPGKTIFIAGLARVDYVSGPDGMFFTFFTSNELYLHKTLTEKADEIYLDKRGSMLNPPSILNKKLPALIEHNLEFENFDGPADRAYVDITLAGLGWVSVTGRGKVTIRVWYPAGCAVGHRSPLMPFESIRGLKPNPRGNMKPYLDLGDVHVYDPDLGPSRQGSTSDPTNSTFS